MQHAKGRTTDLTHSTALLHELVQHGSVTYAELLERYPDLEYDGFLQAVARARRNGLVTGPRRKGGRIRAVGCCPACGRAL